MVGERAQTILYGGARLQALRRCREATICLLKKGTDDEPSDFFERRPEIITKIKFTGKKFIAIAVPNDELEPSSFALSDPVHRPEHFVRIGDRHIGYKIDSFSPDKAYKLINVCLFSTGNQTTRIEMDRITTSNGVGLSYSSGLGTAVPSAGRPSVPCVQIEDGLWLVHKQYLEPVDAMKVRETAMSLMGM